jgi:glutathione synthase/RimK-type ligase-like ATP-grasp enzyme
MHIYPYNPNSESAKKLSEGLGIKRAKHIGKLLTTDILINWGASNIERAVAGNILNASGSVANATNKLSTFKILKGKVAIPEFTESQEEANKWLEEGSVVVARTKLTGHSGEGIVIVDPDDEKGKLPNAKLYTKYIPKTEEYRLHVGNGDVFFTQRKARDKDVPDDKVNWKVRNHGNGFIFAHKGVVVSGKAATMAKKALVALELDFGAVDIIYNKTKDKFYVLEVNTACGLEGTTLEKYVELFKNWEIK